MSEYQYPKLIAELLSIFSNYFSIFIFYRDLISHEKLQSKKQTSFALFQLFFFSTLLEIMTNNINIKINLKRSQATHELRSWTDSTAIEIEAFVEILLCMSLAFMSRIRDYWNIDFSRSIYVMIVNCMIWQRWKQIKRFLKISNLIKNESMNTRDFHWWKKLKSLISDFRIIFKKYWTSDNHVSVDEQLIDFRERFAHAMQLACKTAEVSFKIYSICQDNYLIDFLFISKIRSQNMKN